MLRVRVPLSTFFALAVPVATSLFAQDTADGFLNVNNDKFALKYAAALIVPDSMNKVRKSTRIVLSDQPAPPELLDDEGQLWDLKNQGFHALIVHISETRTIYSLLVLSSTAPNNITVSGTFDPKKLTVFTPRRIEGRFQAAPDKVGETTYAYDVKFAAAILPQESFTSSDAAAARILESAKAYLALVAAIRSGDKQKILDSAPPERRAAMNTPDFPKALAMLQAMLPQNIEILKAVERGEKSKLWVRGVSSGKTSIGKIYLKMVSSAWYVTTESWSNE